jgi:hypothetical protein
MFPVIAQHCDDLLDDFRRYLKMLERFAETRGKFLLLEPWEVALPAVARAAVIDVPAFLNLSCDRATVICAGHQTSKGNLLGGVFRPIVTGEDCLYPLERGPLNEQWMGTYIGLATPYKLPDVEAIL